MIQKHLMKHVIMHAFIQWAGTDMHWDNIIPGVGLSRSFAYVLEAVNHSSDVKMKIFITKQQQRLNDLIKACDSSET